MVYIFFVSLLFICVDGSVSNFTLFMDFKVKYNKSYGSSEEEKRRLGIFMSNMDKVEELNRLNPYAHFGITKFSDLTEEEFKSTQANSERYYNQKQTSKLLNKDSITYTKEEVDSSCTAIDWRKKGAVTAVKDQGVNYCGSCWAFSATGSIEGQWFMAGHPLVSLSEQELVSCDNYDHGCFGGLMDKAFQWLIDKRNGQIITENSLPYISSQGNVPPCPTNLDNLTVGAQIKGYRDLAHDEAQMATFLCNSGPLSVAVDAYSWQLYKNGIMTNCLSFRPNHGVLAVGFDKNNNPPFWIIKNSFGTDWGEDGYIRVAYGSNQCSINRFPTTSIIDSPVPTNTTTRPVLSYTFYQINCDDSVCSEACFINSFPLSTCIPTSDKGSAILHCTSKLVKVKYYPDSINCTGTIQEDDMAVEQCLQSGGFRSYIENFCIPVY